MTQETGHAMEWLGLHFFTELPEGGQVLLTCNHNPVLVILAYLVACAGSFATLDMAERVRHVDLAAAQQRWRWVGAFCLAGGIWAMHFIGMLALQIPIETHYDLPMTLVSLLIAVIASWLAMKTLSHAQLQLWRYLLASIWIGLGICTMHYVGMAAMRSQATAYYQPDLFGLSIAIAISASLVALLLSRYLSNGSGMFHQLLKYASSLLLGVA